jgi:ubiquinone/menaquinone biosynthesis C-methylase UbiE
MHELFWPDIRAVREAMLEPVSKKDHYSYKVYEDPAVAETFDQERFGGDIGEYLRNYQSDLIDRFLPDIRNWRILDAGGGTGRTALPLARRTAKVTIADASFPMLRIAQDKSWLQGCPVTLVRCDAHTMPFPDRSFEAVLSFRLLMHVVDWKHAIHELCRLSSRFLMIDFPPKCGFAGFAPVLHYVKSKMKPHYQPYRVFSLKEISTELQNAGFELLNIDRHLVFPFAFHRMIGSSAFTRNSESMFKRLGMTDLFGAPVTILAERTAAL